jgi:LysR family hydrogen peroxide-inducible transcriptional activator
LVWRKSFTRPQAVEALRQAVLACKLSDVHKLDLPPYASEESPSASG